MTRPKTLTKDDLVRFVRGEKPWRMLLSHGIFIEFIDRKVHAKSSGASPISPETADVAAGFSRLERDRDALREWAAVVLALDRIDMGKLDASPEGELLLEALWDASFGEEVSAKTWSLVRRLAAKKRL
ncbi:MAG: hypothetical protein HY924_02770 [Elusimicrobia bacterium]|nr:hypothetical protein [Elusimicrobiota bacterium]